jgi:hypothetical protein
MSGWSSSSYPKPLRNIPAVQLFIFSHQLRTLSPTQQIATDPVQTNRLYPRSTGISLLQVQKMKLDKLFDTINTNPAGRRMKEVLQTVLTRASTHG